MNNASAAEDPQKNRLSRNDQGGKNESRISSRFDAVHKPQRRSDAGGVSARGTELANTSLSSIFFSVSIFLLPYDALHVMPSTYRPVALYTLVLSLFFYAASRPDIMIFGRRQLMALSFLIVTFVSAAAITLLGRGDASSFADCMLTICLGVVAYFAFSVNLKEKVAEMGLEATLRCLLDRLSLAYVIPICVGILESLSLAGILPGSVNLQLVSLFGGNQTNRLTITSYEASWASVHMVIAAVAFAYKFKSSKSVSSLMGAILAIALFLYTQSMQGIIVAIASVALYIVWLSYKNGNLLVLAKWAFAVVAAVAVVFALFAVAYSNSDTSDDMNRA